MMKFHFISIVVCSLLISGCGGKESAAPKESKSTSEGGDSPEKENFKSYAGDVEGLKLLAADLLGNKKLAQSLKPTKDECRAIVNTDADAKKLHAHVEKIYKMIPSSGLRASEDQTEILVYSATTEELKSGKDQKIPGGYTTTAARYADGLTFYNIKYAKPTETLGMSYHIFFYLKDRWVFVPKPYRAF